MTNCPHCGGNLPATEFGKRTPIPTHSHDTSLNFGKYRGQTVKSLITNDPRYLAWVHNNVESVVFPQEIVSEISANISAEDRTETNKNSWPQSAFSSPHDDYDFEDDLGDDVPF